MTTVTPRGPSIPPPPLSTANGHRPTLTVPAPPAVVREASAPRRWTVRGLALAVITVVLGGLVVMVGIQSFSARHTYLVAAKAVPVGSTITAADVTTARITSDPHLSPIPATQRGTVVGKIAMVDLEPGTLLTPAELGASDGFTAGQMLVALPLKMGQFPARGLAAGQSVLVVATPGADSTSAVSLPASADGPAATAAVVAEVGATDPTSGVTVVDVRVPASSGVGLAQLASTGSAAVILLPAGR